MSNFFALCIQVKCFSNFKEENFNNRAVNVLDDDKIKVHVMAGNKLLHFLSGITLRNCRTAALHMRSKIIISPSLFFAHTYSRLGVISLPLFCLFIIFLLLEKAMLVSLKFHMQSVRREFLRSQCGDIKLTYAHTHNMSHIALVPFEKLQNNSR